MDAARPQANTVEIKARSRINLIQRLIEEGPDPLVVEVCQRICADRMTDLASLTSESLTWREIAAWAYALKLLDADEVNLLGSLDLERRWTLREAHEA